MGAFATLGWHIADFLLKNCGGKQSEQQVEGMVELGEKRAGKVLACCDPTGAEFYDEWLPFATSCCICGSEILPGDGVVLRNINEYTFGEKATLVDPLHAAGCMRAGCGAFVLTPDGYWTKQGYCPSDRFAGVDTPAFVS